MKQQIELKFTSGEHPRIGVLNMVKWEERVNPELLAALMTEGVKRVRKG